MQYRKIYYNPYGYAKEEICSNCVSKTGIADVEELLKKIKNMSKQELKEWMKEVGFEFCSYGNDVDNLIEEKLNEGGEVDD